MSGENVITIQPGQLLPQPQVRCAGCGVVGQLLSTCANPPTASVSGCRCRIERDPYRSMADSIAWQIENGGASRPYE